MDDVVETFEQLKEKAIDKARTTDYPQWVIAYMLANIVDGFRYIAEKLDARQL